MDQHRHQNHEAQGISPLVFHVRLGVRMCSKYLGTGYIFCVNLSLVNISWGQTHVLPEKLDYRSGTLAKNLLQHQFNIF